MFIEWVESQYLAKYNAHILTPFGYLDLSLNDHVICASRWQQTPSSLLSETIFQPLQTYWDNPKAKISIKLQQQGTQFQNKVWQQIAQIPIGEVLTYKQLAIKIDSGARAVANACRDNPFPGIIPCHRVVSCSGLGGYMGQTTGNWIELKQQLLNFERSLAEAK